MNNKHRTPKLYYIIKHAIAAVWIANGLFCKVLNLVPRHEQIVARILGDSYASFLTKAIGFAEIGVAVWILSDIKPRVNVIMQIIIIATMNVIEFCLVPDLLLWGRLNAFFALLLIIVVYYNEFRLRKIFAQ
jgi:hypothetical protein